MNPFVWFLIFSWPLVVLSLLISAYGILDGRPWLVFLGALMMGPFAYSLNFRAPEFSGLPLLLPLIQVGSAAAVKENHPVWAWILFAPTVAVVLWLFVLNSIIGNL
jgi:hypothetical protein